MIVCDKELSRLVASVIGGDLIALAPLLDRLYELGDKRGEHLHSSIGWAMEKINSIDPPLHSDHTHYLIEIKEELINWVKRAFWPEVHGGTVAALEWAERQLAP